MKKVFLSLATIAFVAAGSLTVTSCGSDDSTPVGPIKLTENFIEVNGEQSEISYSLYAVHTTKGTDGKEAIKEYTLQDGRKVIAFEFISHNGASVTSLSDADLTDLTWYTLVDETAEAKYSYPFTKDGATLNGGMVTVMNDTEYSYATGYEFDLTDLVYETESAPGNMVYTLTGNDADDSSVALGTNVNGVFEGLFNMNTDSAAKGANGIAKFNIKSSKLEVRNSLN